MRLESDLLAWLLGPENAETFWRDTWERELMLVQRNDPSYFSSFLDIDDLDRLISSTEFPPGRFDLAKDSVPIPKQEYSRGAGIDVEQALALHREGATIILRAADAWCKPLRRLRAATEVALRSPAQINVYLTPPENQSTPPHWDTHDLFVLQLEGEKIWQMYESPRELPLGDERFTADRYTVGPLKEEFTMGAGDVLYMPRGAIHEPRSATYSVHVALGVPFMRWSDLLAAALDKASREHVELRRSFPVPVAHDDLADLVSGLEERLPALRDPKLLLQAVEELVKWFIETREPEVSGRLAAIAKPAPIEPSTVVGLRDGTCFWTEKDRSRAYLRWRSHSASVPLEFESFVDSLASGTAFRVSDLPGSLSDEAKIATVEALVEDGLLEEKHESAPVIA